MLKVDFRLDSKLSSVLDKLNRESNIAAVPIKIENEEMCLLEDVISHSGDVGIDLQHIRQCLTQADASNAYVLLNYRDLEDGTEYKYALIVYLKENTHARERMMYSAGVGHLQELLANKHCRVIHVNTIGELSPDMLRCKERSADREELMTEQERTRAQIASMEIAPQPTHLPGVEVKLSEESEIYMKRFARGDIHTIIFKVELDTIKVDKKIDTVEHIDDLVKYIPENRPRFVITHHSKKCERQCAEPVMVYVCPMTCTPKERVTYAASRACFMKYATDLAGSFHHRIEIDNRDEFVNGVHEALKITHPIR